MKNIMLILRGCPGSGKDTWVKDNGLQQCTISSDDLRMLYSPLEIGVDGQEHISQDYDRDVWNTFYSILEQKMRQGQFVIVNATNINTKTINKYLALCERFLYTPIIMDFEVSLEELIRRNKIREPHKRVPEEVLRDFYTRKQEGIKDLQNRDIKIISYEENSDNSYVEEIYEADHYLKEIENYKTVKVIGDIHGCYSALMEAIPEIREDTYYIFLGDYLDRGPENKETLNFFLKNFTRPNFCCLYGNHEAHLLSYVENEVSRSQEFNTETKYEIEGIEKKNIRKFLKALKTYVVFSKKIKGNDKLFCCNHAGCPNLRFAVTGRVGTTANYFIKGVGKYEEIEDLYKIYEEKEKNSIRPMIQIHGHRNINKLPMKVNNIIYNLEGQVEFGGCLRVLTIDNKGIHCDYIKNNKTKEIENYSVDTVENFIDSCRKYPKFIIEKKVSDNISSFNFSRQAFFDGVWNSLTMKARGMFINTNTKEIVARGFDKFWNVNEKEETNIYKLKDTLTYPLSVFLKYNGFLGILGYDREKDELLFCSKTSLNSEFSNYFKNIFLSQFSPFLDQFKSFLKSHSVSMAFEVIDPVNDPHIIEYKTAQVKLLAIIKNSLTYQEIPLTTPGLRDELPFMTPSRVKELCYTINNKAEFQNFCTLIENTNYQYEGEYIEGFVIEDSTGYKTKYKTPYYHFWKEIRSAYGKICDGKNVTVEDIRTKGVADVEEVLTFLKEEKDNIFKGDKSNCDGVTIRNKYYEWKRKK